MDPNRSIYRVSPWRRAIFWCAFAPFLALGLGLWIGGGDGPARTAGIVVVATIGTLLVAWEWLLTRTYVALTPDGVELHQLGMQLRAQWADVSALSLRRGREGFLVERPLEGRGAARLAALTNVGVGGAPFYDDEQRQHLHEHRLIPIEAFAWHVQHGTLAREVARLAPHVRIGGEQTAAWQRSDTKGLAWAALITVIALGLAIWFPSASHATAVLEALVAPLALVRVGITALRSWRSRALRVTALLAAALLVTLGWTILAWQGLAELLDS